MFGKIEESARKEHYTFYIQCVIQNLHSIYAIIWIWLE